MLPKENENVRLSLSKPLNKRELIGLALDSLPMTVIVNH